ncbi:MAG: M23 family metallopeptidase, partial [Deltaproteobacteria bacterium]|nr:M23 family metallopeptidase [Deltaproteobacteria bacterium]
QIEVEARALKAAQARLRQSQLKLAAAEQKAQAADAEVDTASEALGPRLTARYRMGREGYVRFLLGSRSISDVLRRKRLYSALLERDFDALGELRFKATGAHAARDDLAKARDELMQSVQVEGERRSSLESRSSLQKRMLASVQREKSVHDQAVRELEQAARELSSKLKDLPPTAAPIGPETPLRKDKGKLLFPCEGGHIEVRFGRVVDPRFGTVTLQHGIDIRAAEGARVFAPHAGKVVHSGWFRGYGNLVILDHGDNMVSLYAHLGTLERTVGDEVRTGDVLGTVGDTGSLKGNYLYFELRDGQKPLDPEKWLSRMRRPAMAKK